MENRIGIIFSGSTEDNCNTDNIVHFNTIFENTEYGIEASNNEGHNINARNNYWGNTSGPYHIEDNPNGKGDNINGNIEFSPWLDDESNYHYRNNNGDKNEGSFIPGFGTAAVIVAVGIALTLTFKKREKED